MLAALLYNTGWSAAVANQAITIVTHNIITHILHTFIMHNLNLHSAAVNLARVEQFLHIIHHGLMIEAMRADDVHCRHRDVLIQLPHVQSVEVLHAGNLHQRLSQLVHVHALRRGLQQDAQHALEQGDGVGEDQEHDEQRAHRVGVVLPALLLRQKVDQAGAGNSADGAQRVAQHVQEDGLDVRRSLLALLHGLLLLWLHLHHHLR